MRLLPMALLALVLAGPAPAIAASCAKEDFARAVDQAGVALRKINADNNPRLQAKMRQLKEVKGWPDNSYEEKAYAALQDERTATLDAQANELLAKLDSLGSVDPASEADCIKLQELTATGLELQATIKAKASYTLAKLDQMLGIAAAPPPKPAPAPPPPKAKPAEPPKAVVPPPPPAAASPPARPPQSSGWSTKTTGEAPRERDVAVLQPSPGPQAVPPLAPEEEGYSIQEIMAASEGLFGKVSANLAAVIEHLFKNSGRPTGYVLGTEGGGAFLAGVRYGDGTLYMRGGGTQKIFWHGPSIGTDVGAAGSKTLFLIYKLQSPEELYAAFTGIDGSAYLVGGVGATLVTNGTRHHGADPLGPRPAARRQHRLHPLHAEGVVESVLNGAKLSPRPTRAFCLRPARPPVLMAATKNRQGGPAEAPPTPEREGREPCRCTTRCAACRAKALPLAWPPPSTSRRPRPKR